MLFRRPKGYDESPATPFASRLQGTGDPFAQHACTICASKMDEKEAREAFRVRQYSGKEASTSAVDTCRELEPGFCLDTSRCILHFDADAFYAQVRSRLIDTCALSMLLHLERLLAYRWKS